MSTIFLDFFAIALCLESRNQAEKKKEEAVKAKNKLESIKVKSAESDTLAPIAKIIERATSNHTLTVNNNVETEIAEKPVFRTDKLSRLNKQERKFLGNIFTTIRNVLPKETAELLILKIEEEYK